MKEVRGSGFIRGFNWGLFPATEKFIEKEINRFLKNNKVAYSLSKKMKSKTSTKFIDWIDHLVIPNKNLKEKRLKELGYANAEIQAPEGTTVFKHTKTIFPPILLSKEKFMEIVLKPENLEDFTKKMGKGIKIKGKKFAAYRKAIINKQGNFLLLAIERRGTNTFIVNENPRDIKKYKKSLKVFSKRERNFKNDKKGLKEIKKTVNNILKNLESGRVADAFFRNERIYWEKRNNAGRIQKSRQDLLGLGWGNHDHHTFRSSRENFTLLIEIFEKLGYFCRERFFAGEESGWGAQVLENPECDIVIFADLDITKKEKDQDFAHKELKKNKKLGTVGLWVGLHGESILEAGMHHLEARFDFNVLRKDLAKKGIKVMKPFSNFQFLKQAFTEGEQWKAPKKRLDLLLKNGSINKDQYNKFLKNKTIGSHLENLQRKQGYKGFNQDSVSAIIKVTDPRKNILGA